MGRRGNEESTILKTNRFQLLYRFTIELLNCLTIEPIYRSTVLQIRFQLWAFSYYTALRIRRLSLIMSIAKNIQVSDYSPYLFWDVDKEKINLNEKKAFLVNRVLDYGVMQDWKQLNNDIGIKEIGRIAIKLRDMDPRSMSFVALLTGIDIKDFRCYTLQQSNPQHWHF